MNIVSELNDMVKEYSGPTAGHIFYDRFMSSDFAHMLTLPLLTSSPDNWQSSTFEKIPYQTLNGLSFHNPLSVASTLTLHPKFDGINTLEELFKAIVSFTSHSNAIGDFRQHPHLYYPVLKGTRYLAFHGDGNCVLLGILLQGFAKHLLGESLDVFYSCGPQREFMHVYCRSSANDMYYDLDQKIACVNSQLDNTYSHGLIFQLLGKAGFHAYDKLSQSNPLWFYQMTHDLLYEFKKVPNAFIYDRHPETNNFSELFAIARAHSEQPLHLDQDDYHWKHAYRELAAANQQNLSFMDKWEAMEITLPPQSTLTIGHQTLASTPTQRALDSFAKVFFGRVMMTLSCQLEVGEHTISIPELPWMILFDDSKGSLRLNGNNYKSSPIPMGMIEQTTSDLADLLSLTLAVSSSTKVDIVMPFNALALNHALITFSAQNPLEIKIST